MATNTTFQMGQGSGNDSCIANVIRGRPCATATWVRLKTRYGNQSASLATFAMDTYADDPCTIFMPKMNFADAHYK